MITLALVVLGRLHYMQQDVSKRTYIAERMLSSCSVGTTFPEQLLGVNALKLSITFSRDKGIHA